MNTRESKKLVKVILISVSAVFFVVLLANIFFTPTIVIRYLLISSSLLLSMQGILTIAWMVYAWENPEKIRSFDAPVNFLPPKLKFSAIVPVRFEEKVIKDTLLAIERIDYPKELKQIIVVVRGDDKETYDAIQKTAANLSKDHTDLVVLIDIYPINKPNQLNYALKSATGDIVTVFDAEDEPHKNLYKVVNTIFQKDGVDIVQGGVQLMNYNSYWFSAMNVLEYFFWFKSGLPFFANNTGVTPLGGNTVFFKRELLQKVGGWSDYALTEDADIGIKLSSLGARTKIFYNSDLATKEETPSTVEGLIKQRTRWSHGFLQILFGGSWLNLPNFKQKIISLYILCAPVIPALMFFYIPVGILIGFYFKLPVYLALLSYLPMFILILLVTVFVTGLYEFTKTYRLKFNLIIVGRLILSFLPYTFLLSYASIRAFIHFLMKDTAWEKTAHLNIHRSTEGMGVAASKV